jgi:carbonic anhydrase
MAIDSIKSFIIIELDNRNNPEENMKLFRLILKLKGLFILLTAVSLILINQVNLNAESAEKKWPPRIEPDEALKMLQEGNDRFESSRMKYANLGLARRQETVKNGQHPYAVILGCSDSRASLEHIFDAGIGEIFVVRVAGNVAGIDEIGSIEYGVEHLKSPLLVVLGHSSCGAVTAVVKGDKVGGSIPPLVANIVPAAEKAKKAHIGDPKLIDYAITENIWQSIKDILSRSAIVRELVNAGELKVVGAFYHLDSGKIEWMGQYSGQSDIMKKSSWDSMALSSISDNLKDWLIIAAILVLVPWLCYMLFIRDRRLFKFIKIKGKLFFASFSLLLGIFLSYYYYFQYALVLSEAPFNFQVLLALSALIIFIYLIIYTVSLGGSLSRSFKALKEELNKPDEQIE